MKDEIFCVKCTSKMITGFIPEISSGAAVSFWVEGEPEYSFWAGGIVIPPDKMIDIVTYRCERCGYLESYARKKQLEDTQKS